MDCFEDKIFSDFFFSSMVFANIYLYEVNFEYYGFEDFYSLNTIPILLFIFVIEGYGRWIANSNIY